MKIRPLHDFVVVKAPKKTERVTSGGFVIPDIVDDDSHTECEVTAVGPGRTLPSGVRVKPEVEVGVKVLLPPHVGTEVEVDGEKLRIVRESELSVVLL